MEDVAVQSILQPPRLIGLGFKPGGDRAESDREAAERALESGPLTLGLGSPARRRGPVVVEGLTLTAWARRISVAETEILR